jgi:hypothetical protein
MCKPEFAQPAMAGLKVISGMKRSGFSETVHVAGILKRAFRNAFHKKYNEH